MNKMLNSMSKKSRGFSLLELMIAVAIVGILSVVAMPYFKEASLRGKRVESKELLLRAASKQEQFFAQYVSYTTVVKGTTGCAGTVCGLGLESELSEQGHFKLAVAAIPVGCSPTGATRCRGFTMTATPVDAALDPDCTALTYTNTGKKGVKLSTDNAVIQRCWK